MQHNDARENNVNVDDHQSPNINIDNHDSENDDGIQYQNNTRWPTLLLDTWHQLTGHYVSSSLNTMTPVKETTQQQQSEHQNNNSNNNNDTLETLNLDRIIHSDQIQNDNNDNSSVIKQCKTQTDILRNDTASDMALIIELLRRGKQFTFYDTDGYLKQGDSDTFKWIRIGRGAYGHIYTIPTLNRDFIVKKNLHQCVSRDMITEVLLYRYFFPLLDVDIAIPNCIVMAKATCDYNHFLSLMPYIERPNIEHVVDRDYRPIMSNLSLRKKRIVRDMNVPVMWRYLPLDQRIESDIRIMLVYVLLQLNVMHQHHVWHSDIKIDNILVYLHAYHGDDDNTIGDENDDNGDNGDPPSDEIMIRERVRHGPSYLLGDWGVATIAKQPKDEMYVRPAKEMRAPELVHPLEKDTIAEEEDGDASFIGSSASDIWCLGKMLQYLFRTLSKSCNIKFTNTSRKFLNLCLEHDEHRRYSAARLLQEPYLSILVPLVQSMGNTRLLPRPNIQYSDPEDMGRDTSGNEDTVDHVVTNIPKNIDTKCLTQQTETLEESPKTQENTTHLSLIWNTLLPTIISEYNTHLIASYHLPRAGIRSRLVHQVQQDTLQFIQVYCDKYEKDLDNMSLDVEQYGISMDDDLYWSRFVQHLCITVRNLDTIVQSIREEQNITYTTTMKTNDRDGYRDSKNDINATTSSAVNIMDVSETKLESDQKQHVHKHDPLFEDNDKNSMMEKKHNYAPKRQKLHHQNNTHYSDLDHTFTHSSRYNIEDNDTRIIKWIVGHYCNGDYGGDHRHMVSTQIPKSKPLVYNLIQTLRNVVVVAQSAFFYLYVLSAHINTPETVDMHEDILDILERYPKFSTTTFTRDQWFQVINVVYRFVKKNLSHPDHDDVLWSMLYCGAHTNNNNSTNTNNSNH